MQRVHQASFLLMLFALILLAGCSSQPEATPQQVNDAIARKKAHEQGKMLDPKSQTGNQGAAPNGTP